MDVNPILVRNAIAPAYGGLHNDIGVSFLDRNPTRFSTNAPMIFLTDSVWGGNQVSLKRLAATPLGWCRDARREKR